MSEHDPHADPLSPYWREKVERAFRQYPPVDRPQRREPARPANRHQAGEQPE